MPFSGTRIATCEEPGPDGTILKGKIVRWEWRDAEGRTRREEIDPPDSKYHRITVTDPVDHVVWNWSEGEGTDRTVILTHYKFRNESVVYSDTYPTNKDGSKKNTSIFGTVLTTEGPGWKLETLTPTYVNGVWAEGRRDVRVVKPGEMNNHTNHLQTVIGITWAAPDLKEVIVEDTNDPGLGKMTDELKKIDRSEPDAALFRPPADYQVLESHPQAPEERERLLVIPANAPDPK